MFKISWSNERNSHLSSIKLRVRNFLPLETFYNPVSPHISCTSSARKSSTITGCLDRYALYFGIVDRSKARFTARRDGRFCPIFHVLHDSHLLRGSSIPFIDNWSLIMEDWFRMNYVPQMTILYYFGIKINFLRYMDLKYFFFSL